jgi:hypothetical protein
VTGIDRGLMSMSKLLFERAAGDHRDHDPVVA